MIIIFFGILTIYNINKYINFIPSDEHGPFSELVLIQTFRSLESYVQCEVRLKRYEIYFVENVAIHVALELSKCIYA